MGTLGTSPSLTLTLTPTLCVQAQSSTSAVVTLKESGIDRPAKLDGKVRVRCGGVGWYPGHYTV